MCPSIIDESCYVSSHKNSELYVSHAFSHRQFKKFLKELDFEHSDRVYLIIQLYKMVKSWEMFSVIL